MVSRGAAVIALASVLAGGLGEARAVTKLEGEYQIQLDVRREDRAYQWDFESNHPDTWTGSHFRLFAAPFANTEAFVKFEADWNQGSNDERRAMFQYRESHMRFKWERQNRGADIYLFQRQDRFWIEKHLIDLVRQGNLTDFGNAQGIRSDLWAFDANLSLIYSDFSGQSNPGAGAAPGQPIDTDDAFVARLRREFFDRKLRLGFTYTRKNDAVDMVYNEVRGLDARYSLLGVDVLLEYADSFARGIAEHREDAFDLGAFNLERGSDWAPDDAAMRFEIRTLRVGNDALGFLNLVPLVWYHGPNYVNQLGDGLRDEQGIFLNSWWLAPQRAITWTLNYTNLEQFVVNQRKFTELYAEMYTEYVNGFTSKLSYRNAITRDFSQPGFTDREENRDVFAEVQVESRLARMRVQGKLKNVDTPRQKEIASLDTTLNLSNELKIYGRYAFGNDPARLRKGLFTELQYRPSGNTEIFVQYGPSWIGDTPNPVDDGDLEGSADNRNLVKLIVKGTF